MTFASRYRQPEEMPRRLRAIAKARVSREDNDRAGRTGDERELSCRNGGSGAFHRVAQCLWTSAKTPEPLECVDAIETLVRDGSLEFSGTVGIQFAIEVAMKNGGGAVMQLMDGLIVGRVSKC